MPNRVAFPSRVMPIPMCQLARSSAKVTAPSATSASVLPPIPVSGWRFARASSTMKGSARNSRQKPAATGPVSAIRTNHGPIASATLPPNSANSSSHAAGLGGAWTGLSRVTPSFSMLAP